MRKKKRKWPKILAMVFVATLLAGSVSLVLVEKLSPDQTYIPKSIVRLPSTIVAAVMKPFEGVFAWASHGIVNYFERWKLQENIEIEYNRMKTESDENAFKALRNEELEAENKRLRVLLNAAADVKEMNPILAYVTTRETGNWFQAFSIDVGKVNGVKINMAVINENGLIGYVSKVYETTSEVISIIDSRARVAGIIQSTRDQGSVRGSLGLDDEPVCRMYYLPSDVVPRPNDIVVTSGMGEDPLPKGIKVGVIRESSSYMDENKRYVVIEPSVDFQHIEEVLVLVYDTPSEALAQGGDPQIQISPKPPDTPRPQPVIGEQIHDPNLGRVTAPPRPTRVTISLGDPDATPTPNPELDEELRRELEAEEAAEADAAGEP